MKSFIILDNDIEYVKKFVKYVNKYNLISYEVNGFTNIDIFNECFNEKLVDILLINESLLSSIKIDVKNIFILNEHNISGKNNIYKYQGVREILSYITININEDIRLEKNITKLIGVFNVDSKKLCYEFTKNIKSDNKLIVNTLSLGEDNITENNLSTLIYKSLTNNEILSCVKNSVIKYDGFEVIYGIDRLRDIFDIKKADWIKFFTLIKELSIYDEIIVIFSEFVINLFEVFEIFDEIIIPTTKDNKYNNNLISAIKKEYKNINLEIKYMEEKYG